MHPIRSTIRHIASGVLAAMVLAAPVRADTITNIATANWTVGQQAFSVSSNAVAFTVADPATSPSAQLEILTPMPGAARQVQLGGSYCAGRTASPSGAASGQAALLAVPVATSPVIPAGHRLVLRVMSAAGNASPTQADSLRIEITSPEGDHETVTAVETGVSTGEFLAALDTYQLSAPYTASLAAGDCRLAIASQESIALRVIDARGQTVLTASPTAELSDPFGLVFDSVDGAPVSGARVSLVDARTGAPASVFAPDGVTPYPASMISGQDVTDAAGQRYAIGAGRYLFPLAPLGEYRLVVEPPSPYTAPSGATPAQLASLRDPLGRNLEISAASFGNAFVLASLDPVRIDIPVDAPGGALALSKTASRERVQAGDAVIFQVRIDNRDSLRPSRAIRLADFAPAALRLVPGSLRIEGTPAADGQVQTRADGRGFSLDLAPLAARASVTVTYAMRVRPDAAPGVVANRATATSEDRTVTADARLRIERDALADRMTIIGRISDDACADPAAARGIPGVRVMLEDGSFAVTDADGRYHFEGVVPGTHVVHALAATLPQGGALVDCAPSTSTAGSASSRFVRGQGGSLARADFSARLPEGALQANRAAAAEAEGKAAATTEPAAAPETDWLALGDGPAGFIAPLPDANPRSPAVRVAVRHETSQTASLTVDGVEADALSFEGIVKDPAGRYAVSHWRGIALPGDATHLTATIRGADGAPVQTFEQDVHYAHTPMRAALVAERSRLVADGTSRPVVAVRFTDRHGRPVHGGISGQFTLESPYESAAAVAARQDRAVTGFGNTAASWVVDGDDGVALIELAPTMISGALRLRFDFSDGEAQRSEELEAWIVPGDQPWTLIGLAEGSVGARSVADAMEHTGDFDSDLGEDARIAFYAKGRVLGKYLLTLAYDSAKQEADQRVLGTIDPQAYYTVFADTSERLFDAPSREKLYVRVESSTFYALYGDFQTGFDQTVLARYQRTLTGVKGEARVGQVQAQAFAARAETRSRRDEIQGAGVTGPYYLSSRDQVSGSETVTIEVRDRLRPDVIVDRRELVRHVDYSIDILSGAITFAQPVASRDAALNPQFIVITFETDSLGQGEWNGGARAAWTSADGKVRVGATAISDKGDEARTNIAAADLRVKLGASTELRAEMAMSRAEGANSSAFSAEVQHHTGTADLTGYVRQVDADYGVGQQNVADRGRRRIGADGRVALTDTLSVIASGWIDQGLDDTSERRAVELRGVLRTNSTDAWLGISHLADHRADGTSGTSTLLEGGATQRLFDNRLEISATTSLPLQSAEAIDLPARHRVSARYTVVQDVRAIASYELAHGAQLDSRMASAGLEVSPFRGNRIVTTVGQQDIGLDAKRNFAAFSFGQTLALTQPLTLDALVDGNRTLSGGIALADVANAAHPVTSGGQLGQDGTLGEDFTAVGLGLSWQFERWAARTRAEWRDGEFADRHGLSLAVIRELGEGKVIGGGVTWTRAAAQDGLSSTVADASLTLALRPARSDFATLSRIEFRSDTVVGALAGSAGPAGRTALLVDGDARSRRVLASTSVNWTPHTGGGQGATQITGFAAVRHNFDQAQEFSLAGTSVLAGFDLRTGLGSKVEIGARATVRHNVQDGTTQYAVGPEIGFSPVDNMVVSLGYNIKGFRDPDFAEARSTQRGLFATVRMKLDSDSFGFLGLGR